MKSEFQQTAASASLIGITAFGGALIGFILQLLVAYYFGASAQTDAYFMALSSSELLSKLLLGGSITAVFLPMFVQRLTRGQKQQAWHLALNLFHLTAAAFIILIFLLGIFAEPFIHFIAPGFDATTSALTIKLLRVLLPAFLFLYLVELTTAMLHALKQFAIPALLRLIAPATSIIVILLLVKTIGIFALALGTVISSVLQLSFLLWGLRRQGLSYRLVFKPLDPAIKRLLILVYPFIMSVLVTGGAGIVYRVLVSELTPGSLAALKFAEKITQLLTIIFLTSVTMVIYPTLSAKAARRDFVGVRRTIAGAIRLITFTTIPIIVGVIILRQPLISFLYQRGSFSAEDAAMTSLALLFLSLGLPVNGVGSVLGHATLALQETRASVAVSIASQAVAIALFVLLVPPLAHAGLALASSLVPLSIALLYFLYLTRFIPNLKIIFWHSTYLKIAALALALAAVVTIALPPSRNLTSIHQLSLFLQLLVPTLAGAAVYFTGAYLWKIPEMHELTGILRRKINL
ncbi:MAG: murein biosynthesis integral membrane protein MurJ [bacterium]